jgi:hypothetical protein
VQWKTLHSINERVTARQTATVPVEERNGAGWPGLLEDAMVLKEEVMGASELSATAAGCSGMREGAGAAMVIFFSLTRGSRRTKLSRLHHAKTIKITHKRERERERDVTYLDWKPKRFTPQ